MEQLLTDAPTTAEAMEQSYQGLSLRRHISWHFKSLWVTDQHRPWTHFEALCNTQICRLPHNKAAQSQSST